MKNNLKILALVNMVVLMGLAGMGGYVQAAGTVGGKKQPAAETKKSQVENKEAYLVTFVELGSVNCIPCKMMQPVMKEIETEYGTQVKVVFYDVWTQAGQPYGEKYQIRAIPTQVFLDKNGVEFFRHTGFFSKAEIVKVLQKQGVK